MNKLDKFADQINDSCVSCVSKIYYILDVPLLINICRIFNGYNPNIKFKLSIKVNRKLRPISTAIANNIIVSTDLL